MYFKGEDFTYTFNGERKTKEEVKQLIDYDTTVSIDGLNISYFSPKKEIKTAIEKIKEIKEKYYPDKLTVNIFNGDIKPNTFYNFFNTLEEALQFIKTTKHTSYTIFDGKNKIAYGENKEHQKMNRLIEEELERQEQQIFKDWNTTSTLKQEPITLHLDSLPKVNLDMMSNTFLQRIKNDSDKCGILGKKESEGKLFYELDFSFIKQMAERMQSNKDNSKYDVWNWKNPMTPKGIEDLKQAMWRHIIAVMEGEFKDDGREFGHLEAISNNAMMINYQLKNNQK